MFILTHGPPLPMRSWAQSLRGHVYLWGPGHLFANPSHRTLLWTTALHNKNFVLLNIFFLTERKLSPFPWLWLQLVISNGKWHKLLKFQHGKLLNKQERSVEDPPLSTNANPVVAGPLFRQFSGWPWAGLSLCSGPSLSLFLAAAVSCCYMYHILS